MSETDNQKKLTVKTCLLVGKSYGDLVCQIEDLVSPGTLPDIPSGSRWATVSFVDGITVLSCYAVNGEHLLTDQWSCLLYDLLPDDRGGVLVVVR